MVVAEAANMVSEVFWFSLSLNGTDYGIPKAAAAAVEVVVEAAEMEMDMKRRKKEEVRLSE